MVQQTISNLDQETGTLMVKGETTAGKRKMNLLVEVSRTERKIMLGGTRIMTIRTRTHPHVQTKGMERVKGANTARGNFWFYKIYWNVCRQL